MNPWYLLLAILTLASASVSLFYAVKSVLDAAGDPERGSLARYAGARSVALFLVALVPLFGRFDGWLLAVAFAMIVVQAIDAVIGIPQRKVALVVGPAVTAVLNLGALILFLAIAS